MAEFFVLRKYRKAGVGRTAACEVFDPHFGRCEVGQLAQNIAVRAFRRATMRAWTSGRFVERARLDEAWRGMLQRFESMGSRKAAA